MVQQDRARGSPNADNRDTDSLVAPRIKLTQHHLSASTTKPGKAATFITVFRPFRTGTDVKFDATVEAIEGGHRVHLDATVSVDLFDDRTTAIRGEKTFDTRPKQPNKAPKK